MKKSVICYPSRHTCFCTSDKFLFHPVFQAFLLEGLTFYLLLHHPHAHSPNPSHSVPWILLKPASSQTLPLASSELLLPLVRISIGTSCFPTHVPAFIQSILHKAVRAIIFKSNLMVSFSSFSPSGALRPNTGMELSPPRLSSIWCLPSLGSFPTKACLSHADLFSC